MVGDILTIAERRLKKTARVNSFITANIALKKLQLGTNKCFLLHTGKKHNNFRNIELYVDWLKLRDVQDVETYFT